ncbi:MAG: exonuclease domain-containing protein [Sarcina sp.]
MKENIDKVEKESLLNVLRQKNIPIDESESKERIIKYIFYHKVNLCKVYDEAKSYEFGLEKEKVKNILNVDEKIFERLVDEGILRKAYVRSGKDFYFLIDIYNLSREQIDKMKEKTKRTSIQKEKTKENHLQKAIRKRLNDANLNLAKWKELDSVENCIVSIVATGNNPKKDHIMEIAIVDMQGETLYHETFRTNKRLSEESYGIKRLQKIDLLEKEEFKEKSKEVFKILNGKTLISYNIEFLKELLTNNGMTNNVKTICLMERYMDYVHSKYIIRFKRALNMQNIELKDHKSKAIEECNESLELINKVIAECEDKVNSLSSSLENQ